MNRIMIITGDNKELIESKIDSIKDSYECMLYIPFPEEGKRASIWGKDLRYLLKQDIDQICISTFSEDLLGIIGHMIFKKELDENKVIVKIIMNNNEIDARYDDEGFIENFPNDYLGIGEVIDDGE